MAFNWFLFSDSRGNRLTEYRVSERKQTGEFWVSLNGDQEIAVQVERVLQPLHCRPAAHDGREWTHHYSFDGPYRRPLHEMLELLKEVLTLTRRPELDTALALDFYKVPPEPPSEEWTNTPSGELVHRAKYWTSNPAEQHRCGGQLSDRLAEVIEKHPTYKAADVIVAVPGTKTEFGEKLARSVAGRVGKPMVTATLLSERPPAKEGRDSTDLEPYFVPEDVRGRVVIVLDDVYRSGVSIRSVAAAARDAGAVGVLGLVAVRAMRAK
jgi:hypothetical protein